MKSRSSEIGTNKQERLRHVCWMITGRCNVWCPMCYAESRKQELGLPQKLEILDKLWALGIRCFTITGGEPLVDPDWASIARAAKKSGFYIGMCTNGLLLTNNLIKMAARFLDEIAIPLDAPTDTLQGIHRHYDEFQNIALSRIEATVSAGLNVDVGTVVTKYNIDKLSMVRRLLCGLKVNRWKLLQYYRLGVGFKSSLDYEITTSKFFDACEQQLAIRDGIQVVIRPGNEAALRSYATLSPSGSLLLAQDHQYVNLGGILSFNTAENLTEALNVHGFNFARHALRPIGQKAMRKVKAP